MSDSDLPFDEIPLIRFRCSRCLHDWSVEAKYAGKKFICPACSCQRVIPDKSVEESTVASLYGVDSMVRDTQEIIKEQAFVSFHCKVCSTILTAKSDEIGQTMVCPDCETENVIHKMPEKIKSKSDDHQNNDAVEKPPQELYGLASETNAETFVMQSEMANLFPVRCPLCHALLYANDSQIGMTLKCPDCFRDVPVYGRPEKPVKETIETASYEGSASYQVAGEREFSPDAELIPVVCSLCHTRMYATVDQIGQEKTCPDCGRKTPIRAVPKEQIKTAAELFPSPGTYGVSESTPNPVAQYNVDYRLVENAIVGPGNRRIPGTEDDGMVELDPHEMAERIQENRQRKLDQKKKKKKRNRGESNDDGTLSEAEKIRKRSKNDGSVAISTYFRPKLPKRPLTQGFWRMFKNPIIYLRFAFSMVFFLVAAPLFAQMVIQYSPNIKELAGGNPGGVIIFLFMYLISGACLFAGSGYHSLLCLAVCESTSNGGDDVVDTLELSPWPALFAFVAVLAAVLVSWLPYSLWNSILVMTQSDAVIPPYMFPLSGVLTFFLFPIALLRIFEGLHKGMFRSDVIWSLSLTPNTWLRFYLLSLPFVIIPMAILYFLLTSENTNVITICSFALAFFLPFLSLCYFRLLGRLTWAIEVAVSKKRDALEELDDI